MFFEKIDNVELLKSEKLSNIEWLQHGFTTKKTGLSKGVYESLNLFSPEEEEFKNVLENRKILSKVMNFNYENLTLARQVHGKNVFNITSNDIGRGSFDHAHAIAETDSLITNISNVPIMLLYADCLPIIIADKKNKAIGVVHAGWKGTAQAILDETIKAMFSYFNSQPENLFIAFGVGISKKNFQIGQEAFDLLSKVNYSDKSFEFIENKIYADLIEINTSQALNLEIPKENIDYNKELCTYDNEDLFYSYRRDNKITGRHSAVALIKDGV